MFAVMRFWLALGALYGFIAVAMGAMGAHFPGVDDAGKEWLRTASLYQAIHALALIGVAALSDKRLTFRLSFAGLCFALGVLLFSGGLYARALLGLDLGALVPAGGMAFLAGWLLLFVSAFGRR
jgi:uncharacterized membrane protein YgdD (TMEM256/DUF423 family)